jgi:hypothetical protein
MGSHFCEETKELVKNNRTPSWSKFPPTKSKDVPQGDGGRGERGDGTSSHSLRKVLWDPFLVVIIQVQCSSNQPNLKK